ncbi:IS1-like element transposase, partial [Enterobacter hormaechei subsp. xiangfangensis]|uniref:IS1-like element transposase n=1 Tax=Enterobacter hormaechei TaxID=158836 RepID=UPI002877149A
MASVSISCPSCSATDGVVRNGKSTAGHQRYLCSHCRKTWQLQFTYTASQPGTHQKIIDMAMNGVGCRATARIMGVGLNTIFAYAQDNLCLLANEVTTVNGQRARFFGPDQATLEERNNLASDVFFNWLNTPEAVAAFWKAQTPAMQQRIEGYVAGYNRYLKEQGAPAQCQAA